jgi:TolB-like protein/tetratricopeptide (TPR) repeat protein
LAPFAHGLVEDLVADLSKLPNLLVIPRYLWTTPADISSAIRELGAQYVIRGTVRLHESRVRITVQLTAPALNRQVWADRVDGDVADVFHWQDEVVTRVLAGLASVLSAKPMLPQRIRNFRAYDLLVRGRALVMHSPIGNNVARTLLSKAIGLDPACAEAHAYLAISHYGAAVHYHVGSAAQAWRGVGLAYSKKALSLDPTDPSAHRALGYVRLYARELDQAEAELQAGLTVTPSHADLLANMADLKVFQGQPQNAIAWVEKALRLNADPADWYYWTLGFALYAAGRYAEAVHALCKEEVDRLPAKRILAASLAQLGRIDEAREEARRFLDINPGFGVSHWAATQPFSRNEDRKHFVDGYLKAGLPK